MMTTLKVRRASNYGRTVVYPVCDQSKRIASIAGTTTLTPETLRTIKAMGFQFVELLDTDLQTILN